MNIQILLDHAREIILGIIRQSSEVEIGLPEEFFKKRVSYERMFSKNTTYFSWYNNWLFINTDERMYAINVVENFDEMFGIFSTIKELKDKCKPVIHEILLEAGFSHMRFPAVKMKKEFESFMYQNF